MIHAPSRFIISWEPAIRRPGNEDISISVERCFPYGRPCIGVPYHQVAEVHGDDFLAVRRPAFGPEWAIMAVIVHDTYRLVGQAVPDLAVVGTARRPCDGFDRDVWALHRPGQVDGSGSAATAEGLEIARCSAPVCSALGLVKDRRRCARTETPCWHPEQATARTRGKSGRVRALIALPIGPPNNTHEHPPARVRCQGQRELAPSPDFSRGLMAAASGRLAGFWSGISGPGCDGGPAVGPGGRGSTSPGVPFLLAGTGFNWSNRVRHGLDELPGSGDLVGPGQVAAILRVRRRPPRTRRAAACRRR